MMSVKNKKIDFWDPTTIPLQPSAYQMAVIPTEETKRRRAEESNGTKIDFSTPLHCARNDEATILYAPLQPIQATWLSSRKVEAAMLRLDLLHPEVSGNKWFKLKYNIAEVVQDEKNTLLTFGGVWSNHIAATAAACHLMKMNSIGLIRGTEPERFNATLSRAKAYGMQLYFISREQYRNKTDPDFLKWVQQKYPDAYIVPEGGNNKFGFKGAQEILDTAHTKGFTHICCPVGTGVTLAGIISKAEKNQQVLGFVALKKAEEQAAVIENYLNSFSNHASWQFETDYHFGGFAKRSAELIAFVEDFQKEHGIPLDFVYTAKMMFGIKDKVQKDFFPAGSRLLIIHTGGLQGNNGFPPFNNQ